MKVLVIEKGKEPYYAILTPSMVARKYSKKIYLSTGRQTGKQNLLVEELQKLIRKQNGGPAGEREQKRVYNRKKQGTEKQKKPMTAGAAVSGLYEVVTNGPQAAKQKTFTQPAEPIHRGRRAAKPQGCGAKRSCGGGVGVRGPQEAPA